MTDTNLANSDKPQTRRQLMFVVLGIFLLSAAGWLVSDRLRVHTTLPITNIYSYTIRQDTKYNVKYRGSSFYDGGPSQTDTAYLSNLTDSINARFSYNLSATDVTALHYEYGAKATVRGTYGSTDSTLGISNVWSKDYVLLEPTTGTQNTGQLALDPEVQVPYTKLRAAIDQFKLAFDAAVNTELLVTYTVKVSGSIDGTPFSDTKVSTLSAPLDQQIYKINSKFVKSDHHDVVPKQSQKIEDIITMYEVPLAVLLTILGLAYTVYGLRRQIIKSPYQRELEKIYRYHDGIIIHASRPADLAHKDIVMVKKFDDLLNLEEELKTPIIASQVNDATTHFFIARDDIVYVFTLGEQVAFKKAAAGDTPSPTTTSGATSSTAQSSEKKPPKPPRKVMG